MTLPLGEILAVLKNGLNCKQKKNGPGDRVSRIESISDGSFDCNNVGYAQLTDQEKAKFSIEPGDILFSHINSAPHVGKTASFSGSGKVYHGVNLLLMRPTRAVTSRYLHNALKALFESGYWRAVCKQSVNQASVNQQDIGRVEIRFPTSIAEQERIVAILDQAFESIAGAKANAEKNLQNARNLFDSHLQSVFTKGGEGWTRKSVGELVAEGALVKPFDGNHGEIHPRRADYTEAGVPFVMACDLQNGSVDTVHCTFISRKLADSLRVGFASHGDVLISHKGTIGRSAIISTNDDYIMLTPQVTSYRVKDPSKLFNRFIRYYFMSPDFQREMIAAASEGSTRAYIGITRQLTLHFCFPSLVEQKKIVAGFDVLDLEIRRLASIYQRKLAALEALKKSLLYQAFTGNL